jgi:hypothetical protein
MASDNSYISNKKYTYDEVTEILSDKIIENRKKIDELRTHSYKEDSEVKKIVDDLKIRVDKLSSQINMQKNNTKLQHSNNNKVKDEKNIKPSSVVEEIIIEKELLEKVQ